jgi:hypothetical protein
MLTGADVGGGGTAFRGLESSKLRRYLPEEETECHESRTNHFRVAVGETHALDSSGQLVVPVCGAVGLCDDGVSSGLYEYGDVESRFVGTSIYRRERLDVAQS